MRPIGGSLKLDRIKAAAVSGRLATRRSNRLRPRQAPHSFEEIVSRYRDAGMREFVLFWPPVDRLELFERIASDVLPALKA